MKILLIAILTFAFSLTAFAATTSLPGASKNEVNQAKASEEKGAEDTSEATPEDKSK